MYNEPEVIAELRKYFVERRDKTGELLRMNHITDHNVYRMLTARYLELEDVLNKLDELVEDAEIELLDRTDDNDGWIPCEERLPEKDGRYVVTVLSREDKAKIMATNFIDGSGWFIEMIGHVKDVLAWKECKPYEKPVL